MGKRRDELEKKLSEVNIIVDGSESKFWQIIGRMVKNMKDEAINAFHTTNIDNVDNPELLRQFMSQRVKAKTCGEILGFVENAKITKELLETELIKIDKLKGGRKP